MQSGTRIQYSYIAECPYAGAFTRFGWQNSSNRAGRDAIEHVISFQERSEDLYQNLSDQCVNYGRQQYVIAAQRIVSSHQCPTLTMGCT